MARDQSPRLDWRGTVPVATRFDDPYFSLEDGLAETRHVFLDGNRLPERFRPGFAIAELGFGTGLNLCAAMAAWKASGQAGRLVFTSFEAFPLSADVMARALAAFPELAREAAPVLAALAAGGHAVVTPRLEFRLIEGDARKTLPRWGGQADAWFLDGF